MGDSSFTDMMMANPWMFDPSQRSNQFSLFNNAPIPYPATYSGVPVNAATGRPIQSFLDWQRMNPAGMTLNATPQPQQQAAPSLSETMLGVLGLGPQGGPRTTQLPAGVTADQMASLVFGYPVHSSGPGPTATPAAAPQAAGPPNNWNAAISALANPGNPVTPGATVPMATGYQPAGGVNAAFLQQAMGRPGMNQNFLSALSALQGRRQ